MLTSALGSPMPNSGASIKKMTAEARKGNDCRPTLIGYAGVSTKDGRELPGGGVEIVHMEWNTTGNRWSAAQRKATAKAGLDPA